MTRKAKPTVPQTCMYRVYREDDTWVVLNCDGFGVYQTYSHLEAMPEPLRSHLAVLNASAEPIHISDIGQRINSDIFWVFSTKL